MTYNKPEVVKVANAAFAIRGVDKPQIQQLDTDNSTSPYVSNSAYVADE